MSMSIFRIFIIGMGIESEHMIKYYPIAERMANMKALLPYTADMRYERALIGMVAGAILFFLTLQFGSIAMLFAEQTPDANRLVLQGSALRLSILVLASAAFFCFSLRFLASAIQKMIGKQASRYPSIFNSLRMIGILTLRLGFACVVLWIAANLALRFMI